MVRLVITALILSWCYGYSQASEVSSYKDPKKAFIFSLIPGGGQAYNGKWIKSAVVIGLEVSSYLSWRKNIQNYNDYDNIDLPLNRSKYLLKRNKYAWWMGIIYVYSMIDAIVDAHLHSFEHVMNSPLENDQKERNEYEQ